MPCERCGRRCEGRLCADCGTETRQASGLPPMGATFDGGEDSDDGEGGDSA